MTPQTILITGTSSGFGMLTAARLASSGHKVVATMRNIAKKDDLLKEVSRRNSSVDIFQLDVTNVDSIGKTVAEVIGKHKRIDVLINNAGYGVGGFFEDLTQEEIRQQFEVNFFGVQNVTREVIPYMRKKRQGKIINISSVSGFSASPAFGAYSASKWALEAFSESLYYEMRLWGIHVCLIRPGTYPTKIFTQNARYASAFDTPNSPYFVYSQKLKKKVMDYVGRCRKDPEKIAALIEKLINHPNPPLHSIPDIESKIIYTLRRILPFAVYSRIIRTALYIKQK